MNYTAQAIFGSTGQRTMAYGFDLSNLKPEFQLGDTPVVDREVVLDKKVYTVSDLMSSNVGLKFDLILNMMLRDGTVDFDTKVKVGHNGRMKDVHIIKSGETHRIWGKTYYGKI